MSQSNFYTVFCIVLGEDVPFSIEIKKNDLVDKLKKLIKEKRNNTFANIGSNFLNLYLVNIPIHELAKRMKKLQLESLQRIEDVTVSLKEVFNSAPQARTIHILVQPPSIGFEEIEGSDEEGGTRARKKRNDLKRAHSPSIGLDTQSRKRTATGHSTVPSVEAARRKVVSAIHSAIKNIPEDVDLSNPATFIMLPFPSPHPALTVRFQTNREEGIEYFRYMGRSKFTQLKECTESHNFVKGREDIYLYGSSGSGKSHILAAFVFQLIREGKRVLYIPNCRDLLKDFDHTIRIALCFAFYDDPTSLQIIESALDVEGLVKFWMTVDDKYLIVDQLNALEIAPNRDILETVKRDAVALLGKMSFRHRCIYSAFANELSDRDVNLKQAPIKVISFLGGMNGGETQQWFEHYSNDLPRLSKDDRRRVEYLTGRIPILLSSLFEFKDKAFDEHKFLQCSDLAKVKVDVTKYSYEKLEGSQEEQAQYFGIMKACLRGARIVIDLKQYDLRYFYVDQRRGHYTCGVAFETMMLILREHRFQSFRSPNWHAAVSATENPIARGFIAEQICLHSISTGGLPVAASHLTRMEVATFSRIPDWREQIDAGFTLQLYIPTASNVPNIAAIILWLDLESKVAHLYPIQITLSRDHKNSEDRFYADDWYSWVGCIVYRGFTVNSTFVWIDKEQPSAQHRKAKTVSPRRGVKPAQPERQSIHVGIRQVDEGLGKNLMLE